MKRTALVVFVALAATLPVRVSDADHGSPWLVAVPDTSEPLPVNGRITLFAVNGPATAVVEHRRLEYQLVSDTDSVPLRVIDFRRGADWDGYGASHIVLAPRRRLRPSTRYRLEIRSPEGSWTSPGVAAVMTGPTATYGGPGTGASWVTTDTLDRTAPRWIAPPAVVPDPDGLADRNIVARIDDASAVWFRIRAVPDRGSAVREATYHQDVFGIQGGCAWLPFDEGRVYQVTLVAMDAAGNGAAPRTLRIDTRTHSVGSLCLERS